MHEHEGVDRPRAVVVRTAGTNCDAEMVRAFRLAGASCEVWHVDALSRDASPLHAADLIGLPGGFSHGDDLASGRIFAARLRERLWPALREAAERGCLMIGACNGFQVMVQAGLLPGPAAGGAWPASGPPAQTLALATNAGARFVDRWVSVRAEPGSPCVWTRPLAGLTGEVAAEVCRLPIAHGEGRVVAEAAVLDALEAGGRVALRYGEQVNGSARGIAGVCDASGRIFGLMPHPERYLDWTRHPWWTRLSPQVRQGETPGLAMFRAAVEEAGRTRPSLAGASRGLAGA